MVEEASMDGYQISPIGETSNKFAAVPLYRGGGGWLV